ncbi:MAG: acyl carrier protein [Clostridia bacterium]|nr:acyl carrier protein [Clostridia bacterium]MCR5695170.1 acyl carrier protein [Clostridia bacterium]
MFEEVKKLLVKELRLKDVEITPESRIKEDLHADSLSVLTLLMTIEEEFNITIPDEELMKFNTVGDVVKFLEGLKK